MLRIFEDVKREVSGGACASYIPALASADPSLFAVSICTVDGQQFSCGDAAATFSFQSCVKPLIYAVAVEDRGLSLVHRHVGFEPSGLAFNEVSLNPAGLPHNPMVNAGAISTGALVGPGCVRGVAGRGAVVPLQVTPACGCGAPSPAASTTRPSSATSRSGCRPWRAGARFPSRRRRTWARCALLLLWRLFSRLTPPATSAQHETAWRNNALVAYMTDAGVFPRSVDPTTALDFYLQACSVEVDTAFGANVAATLAAGGVSPLTGERCLSAVTTKATLTLMFSCGMYDYSGEWMSAVDLPAKSGVSGIIYVVVPHIMGIAVFAPPLDSHGNSVRGVEFCKRLLREYDFGVFDQIVGGRDDGTAAALSSRAGGGGRAIHPSAAASARDARGGVHAPSPAAVRSGGSSGASHSPAPLPARATVAAAAAVAASQANSSASDKRVSLGKGPSPAASSSAQAIVGGAGSVMGDGGSVLGSACRVAAVSGHRLDKARRLGLALRRLSRAWMLLRAWSGLPVAAGDLALLEVRGSGCESCLAPR